VLNGPATVWEWVWGWEGVREWIADGAKIKKYKKVERTHGHRIGISRSVRVNSCRLATKKLELCLSQPAPAGLKPILFFLLFVYLCCPLPVG